MGELWTSEVGEVALGKRVGEGWCEEVSVWRCG